MNNSLRRRVVVVMPCLNSASSLRLAIDAFLFQGLIEKKLVIVDGKSSDGSHKIISSYATQHSEIVWIREKDVGISSALNIAMAEIGDDDIWGYLGADDILLPGVLEKVASLFGTLSGLNGAYFDSYSQAPGRSPVLRHCPEQPFSMASLLRYGTIAGLQNFFLDGALVRRYRFNESARYSMDYELYLRMARDGFVNCIHVPIPSTLNVADDNLSTRFADTANLEALGFAVDTVGYRPIVMWRYSWHMLCVCKCYFIKALGLKRWL